VQAADELHRHAPGDVDRLAGAGLVSCELSRLGKQTPKII